MQLIYFRYGSGADPITYPLLQLIHTTGMFYRPYAQYYVSCSSVAELIYETSQRKMGSELTTCYMDTAKSYDLFHRVSSTIVASLTVINIKPY